MLIYNPKETELIDIDDVIRDWSHYLNFVWNRENPNNKRPLPRTWKLALNYGPEINKFYKEKHAEEIYTKAPVIQGAIEFLNKLIQSKFVFLISTQPTQKIEDYTRYWLKKNNIPYHDLKFTQDKGLTSGEYLLDDAPFNLERVLEAKSSKPVCFNQPWNQDWKGLRVYNYQEFLDLVENHK